MISWDFAERVKGLALAEVHPLSSVVLETVTVRPGYHTKTKWSSCNGRDMYCTFDYTTSKVHIYACNCNAASADRDRFTARDCLTARFVAILFLTLSGAPSKSVNI